MTALLAAASAIPATAAGAEDDGRCVQDAEVGQLLRDEGKLVEARQAFLRCAQQTCPRIVQADCLSWADQVARRIPAFRVRALDARGDDALNGQLFLDGEPVALDGRAIAANPGEHELVLVARGLRQERRFLLLESERERVVEVRLPASGPLPAMSAQRHEPRPPEASRKLG